MALNELLRLVADSETPETTLIGATLVPTLTGEESLINLNVDAADVGNEALHIDCLVEVSPDEEEWGSITAFSWDGNTTNGKNGGVNNGPAIRFSSTLISGKHIRITATANLPMRYVMLLQEVV